MLKKLIFTIAIFASIWAGGLLDFYGRIPTQSPVSVEHTDAIIVLTGGKNRIEAGLELLRRGNAPKMFITGVGKDVHDLALLRRLDVKPNNAEKISLGHEAINTFGNVAEAQKWIDANHIKSITLVTANYHMPRAHALFARALPDVQIVSYPVMTPDFVRENWFSTPKVRRIILLEYQKFLLSF